MSTNPFLGSSLTKKNCLMMSRNISTRDTSISAPRHFNQSIGKRKPEDSRLGQARFSSGQQDTAPRHWQEPALFKGWKQSLNCA